MEDALPVTGEPPARHAAAHPHRTRRTRARLSPLTVIGELLLVSGAAILGFFGWQDYHTLVTVTAEQQQLAGQDSARWQAESEAHAGDDAGSEGAENGEIPVTGPVAEGEVFGVLYIPAMGKNFAYRVAEGTDQATVLSAADKGIGRYPSTQLPGEPGNMAIAAHRSGPWITPFREVMDLRLGDPLYLETAEGWYTYRFRSLEYALPNEVDVLNPVPRMSVDAGEDRILTLTTCHPKANGTAERAIAYAVLDGFRARAAGPPPALVEANTNVAKEAA